MRLRLLLLVGLLACSAPADNAAVENDTPGCDTPQRVAALPKQLREASGIVVSRRNPGILWVHNDSGEPVLFAVDTLGNLHGRVRIANVVNLDWEDISIGDCAGQSCLYIGAIGDNLQNRADRAIYEVLEPLVTDSDAKVRARIPYRMDKPEDTEAFFVAGGNKYLITKGRSGPILVYALPEMRVVQQLTTGLVQLPDMVTAAAATPDGKHVVVRTYSALQLYTFEDTQLKPLLPQSVDLQSLNEFQGEGADITANGVIYLVSEKGLGDEAPPLSKVVCRLSPQ